MYEDLFHFFGLREDPFHVSPDPRYYFATHSHDLALKQLAAGIESRRGLFVLTGEAGTGKTALVRRFLDWLEARHQSSCYIFHSQLRPMELLELTLQDFGIACGSRDKHDIVVAFNRWLVERRRMGDSPVLVVDEAQTSPLRTLRRLNVLLNLELDGCKLLQVVLAGQPELDDKLQRPELWQLRQRIISRTRLMALTTEETVGYVRSRLEKAGAPEEVFCEEALQAVHMSARGIPRLVNLLCEHALIAAYSEKAKPITAKIVREVATDFDLNVQTGVGIEEEVAPRAEWMAAPRMEESSAAPLRSNATVPEENVEEVKQEIPPGKPSPSKWPILAPNVERHEGAAQAGVAEKVAPMAVVENEASLVMPAEAAGKFPEVVAVAAVNPTPAATVAAVSANVHARTTEVNTIDPARTGSVVSVAAACPVEVPSTPEGRPAPRAMAAAATTLSTAPALMPKPVELAVPATPQAAKATGSTEKPAKLATASTTTKAAVARVMRGPVVPKPLPTKPTLVKPVNKPKPKVVKPTSAQIWKFPGFVKNCLGYGRAVVKSFVADWKQFMQAPIQTRKQTGAGTGNG